MKEHKSTITLNSVDLELTYTLSEPVEDVGDLDVVDIHTVSGDGVYDLIMDNFHNELYELLWDKINDNEPCEDERGCW